MTLDEMIEKARLEERKKAEEEKTQAIAEERKKAEEKSRAIAEEKRKAEEKTKQAILKMIDRGFGVQTVSEIMGLSVDEIISVADKYKKE